MSMHRIFSCLYLGLALGWSVPAHAVAGKTAPGPLMADPVGAGDYFQMFFGLILVIGIIFGMAWFIRRMGSFQQVSHGALRILGGLSLGQRERIVLVQVGDRQLLIGLAPGQIRTLHVLDQPVVMGDRKDPAGMSFADRLQSVLQGKAKR